MAREVAGKLGRTETYFTRYWEAKDIDKLTAATVKFRPAETYTSGTEVLFLAIPGGNRHMENLCVRTSCTSCTSREVNLQYIVHTSAEVEEIKH